MNNILIELKDENNRLLSELQFAQNLIKLLENYRNLVNICLNNCENCQKNQELIQKFNNLEIDYNKDLNFSKEKQLFFNNNNDSINKKIIETLLSQKSETIESNVDLIDINESDINSSDEDIDSIEDKNWNQRLVNKRQPKRGFKL